MKPNLKIFWVLAFACGFLVACSNSEGVCEPSKNELSKDSSQVSIPKSETSVDSVEVKIEESKDSVAKVDEQKDSALVNAEEVKDSIVRGGEDLKDSSSVKEGDELPEDNNDIIVPFDTTKCGEVRTTKNDFVPLENVLACVKKNEKVAFIVRHGEREPADTGPDDHLNANGIEGARNLGKKLKAYPDFYYMHTYYMRTMETAYYVAEGKGQNVEMFTRENADGIVHEMTDDLLSYWYETGNISVCACDYRCDLAAYTKMAYVEGDDYCDLAFYNAKARTLELVEKYFTYEKMHDVTFAVSHDYFVAPLMIAITDGEIGMDFHNHYGDYYYWPNFLSGAAFIVDEKNHLTMIPVKGLESGRQGTYSDI